MKSAEIRKRFIDYFVSVAKSQNLAHIEVPSSPLIPENHPTLLFTNSGMVQFTPYFLGQKDPVEDFGSKRLCSVQKCIRTGDLDIVGKSKYHLTFFEMLGSWSVGDYGKKTAVELAFDLLTNREYGFGLDPKKFYPTVFEGDAEVPFDQETYDAWVSVGIPEDRISKLPASENWWAPGPIGPCGPCTEVLYDRGEEFGSEESRPGLTDNPRYLEIWNAGVFMQYNRDSSGKLNKLDAMSVDTGAGLERFAVLLQKVDSVYYTDIFEPVIRKLIDLSKKSDLARESYENASTDVHEHVKSSLQRVSDHLRNATFLIGEGLFPSNKDQGYVLRRLIRRSFDDCVWNIDIDSDRIIEVIDVIIDLNKDRYPEVNDALRIKQVIQDEINTYKKIADETRNFLIKNYINKGLNIVENPFDLYQSLGSSKELIENLTKEQNLTADFSKFDEQLHEHQEKSKANVGQRFKGGLGENTEETTKLHTATHLLHQALRDVLGSHVRQMGSNITPERLRFDFSHEEKLTQDQISNVEEIINEKVMQSLPVNKVQLSKEEAEKTGALHFFKEKYADQVTVYYIGDSLQSAWSKEFCGGPHVSNTSEIGHIKIAKEESVGKGVRRIKAVLD